jgi:hypothetical protein
MSIACAMISKSTPPGLVIVQDRNVVSLPYVAVRLVVEIVSAAGKE